jgi:8-oxo-dGTP diphosphatase
MTPKSTPVAAVALIERDGMILTTTRRGTVDDFALVGGGIEPGESAFEAMKREVREEAGIEVLEAHYVFERVDEAGNVAWCFQVTKFVGEPKTVEQGVKISWRKPTELLSDKCTFRDYNRRLFIHLGMMIEMKVNVGGSEQPKSDGTCPKREDGIHCVHWWDGDAPCCGCGFDGELDND